MKIELPVDPAKKGRSKRALRSLYSLNFMTQSDASLSNAERELDHDEDTVSLAENEALVSEADIEIALDNEVVEEHDFDHDDDEAEGTADGNKIKRRFYQLHCFHCNRKETFYNAYRGYWIHSFFLGFTFGLANIIGPFKCKCCGHRRLMQADFLNPKMWFRKIEVDSTRNKRSQ